MKIKKKTIIISAVALTVAIAVTVGLCLRPKKPTVKEEKEENTSYGEVTIEEPSDSVKSSEADDLNTVEVDDADVSVEMLNPEDDAAEEKSKTTGEKVQSVAEKVTAVNPPADENKGGIIIGDGGETKEYSCGVNGHHCESAETHAFIQNLELEGCPYCHSNNCPSFYATDEWGNACYTPSKCSKYDAADDPASYCQTCHKKCGDGKNGTCVQFINACKCPNCNKNVGSFECHTCEDE